MTRVRPAAVAGTFYPRSRAALRETVGTLLASAVTPPLTVEPHMAIVPHAGYVYSGPVAATAYAALGDLDYDSILLLGPAHFLRFKGLATPGCDALETPFGAVAVDPALAASAAALADDNRAAHEREHSLEVQLPFLQALWPGTPCLPVLTGDDDPDAGAHLLRAMLAQPATLVIISSDLSHYLDQASAQRRDAATAQTIVELRSDDLAPHSACGRTAIRAGLRVAAEEGWDCQLLDLRTSGDTLGAHDRVVGYGAFLLGPGRPAVTPPRAD